MKEKILEISDKLRNNKITEIEAKKLLLSLFCVIGCLPDEDDINEHSKNTYPHMKESGGEKYKYIQKGHRDGAIWMLWEINNL